MRARDTSPPPRTPRPLPSTTAHPDGYAYYAATPAYVGDELAPRSVFVDVLSSDSSINDHVEAYNAAAGNDIDNATREFSPAG